MIESRIELVFEDTTVASLAGYNYGLSVYEEQVKPKVNYDADKIVIVFPECKKAIASSFVEGFFDQMIKNIGLIGIREKVEIVSDHKKIKDIINRCLN